MRRAPIIAVITVVAAASVAACVPPPPEGASYSIQCPVKGRVSFTNDWQAPRGPGLFHEGNDVFAPMWTQNVAVVSGVVDFRTGTRSGNAIWLDGDDGNDYFYAHFAAWNGSEGRVAAGDVIGYTGMTGDAAGTAPHTHFEIHPAGAGGDAINPYPSLVAACTDRAGVSAASSEHGDVSSAADDGLER
jgi:murein DD-endopeptidase MepM/ murein hydrolase activator NlpD